VVGWAVAAAAEQIPPAASDSSVTVALIAALGTVLVALIGLAAQWLSRSIRTGESPPQADPKLGERIAVAEIRHEESTRTLAMLDRHVDAQGDDLDRLRWRVDDLLARFEEHMRRHHGGL
jgi:hypothetical protein